MRAIAYYRKYHGELIKRGIAGDQAATDLLQEMITEGKDLILRQHIVTDRGILSVFEDLNQKWNAIVSIFEKRGEVPPIARDGFRNYAEGIVASLMAAGK